MSTTYGYGAKTFVQALAALCCRMAKYIVKHDAKLKKFLPSSAYTCITGASGCLSQICELKNRSAR